MDSFEKGRDLIKSEQAQLRAWVHNSMQNASEKELEKNAISDFADSFVVEIGGILGKGFLVWQCENHNICICYGGPVYWIPDASRADIIIVISITDTVKRYDINISTDCDRLFWNPKSPIANLSSKEEVYLLLGEFYETLTINGKDLSQLNPIYSFDRLKVKPTSSFKSFKKRSDLINIICGIFAIALLVFLRLAIIAGPIVLLFILIMLEIWKRESN